MGEFKARILYDSVNIKPGKPTVFGVCTGKPVFGLAGNPVSSSTIFEILVLPALRKMMGFSDFERRQVTAWLESAFQSRTRRDNYHPALTRLQDDRFLVMPLTSRGSADVLAFSKCNSFLVVPGEIGQYAAGDAVSVILMNDFWPA